MKRWYVGMTALGLACGGDSTGPSASSVTGIAGNNQSAPTGGTLALPLSFTTLGSDGLPIEGVSVSWSVTPTGRASFSPQTSETDPNGVASTNVTMGSTAGPITIQATVPGVQPVVYQATILDPCIFIAPYTLGDTVSGALSRTDCQRLGFFYDFYALNLPAGQHRLRIAMNASTFDPYLELFTPGLVTLGEDDDIVQGTNQNSRLDIILGQGGSYVIGANSFDADTVGAYTISATNRATSLSGCSDPWVTPGVTIVDTVRTTDCQLNGSYFDFVLLWVTAGSVLQFAQRSTGMDPLIKLYHANFQTLTLDSVAANDDSSAGNQNAYISYTVPNLAGPCCLFQLRLGTAIVGDTGEYTLVFSPMPPSPTAGPSVVPGFLRAAPPRAPKGLKEKIN